MVDVCNPANFPPMKYFQQYELAEFGPADYEYRYTRCFLTRMEATVTGSDVDTLHAIMEEYRFNGGPIPGRRRQDESWEGVLARMLSPGFVASTNPFDFALWSPTRVIMLLKGRAWRYSPSLAPLTMKHQYGGQYFDLRLHRWDPALGEAVSLTQEEWQTTLPNEPCRCVSFFTREPCRDSNLGGPGAKHGFSLNVDLLYYDSNGNPDGRFLPITVDPDIENKGGHG